jgi:hypothetical protein
MNTTATLSPSTPIVSISTPQLRDLKDGHILSPAEIGAIATFDYQKSHAPSAPPNQPYPTKSSFPVASAADLPQVVYHDPFYGTDETGFGLCIQAKNPGSAVLVHPLTGDLDYYIVPFFKDNKLCATALVEVRNGAGFVTALGQAFGDQFPQGNADEAIQQVRMKTGKQVGENPVLVFGAFIEAGDPLDPIWKVITTDNQIYYVIFITGPTEDSGKIETTVTVLNANEVHPIK